MGMRSVKSFDNAAVPFLRRWKISFVNSGGNVMTAKIIKADADTVTLGYEDGSFEDVPRTELPFGPEVVKVGTVLDVYQNGEQRMYTVSKSAGEAKGKRKVNKLAYVLCAILVGGLGIHKFLAGRWVLGIIYILFCWTFIPALVALIEGIMAAMKNADEQGNIEV